MRLAGDRISFVPGGGESDASGRQVLDDGRRQHLAVDDLVPRDRGLAVPHDDGLRPLHEPGVLVGRHLLDLVAGNVDVRPRRHRRQFPDHVVEELERDVFFEAEVAEADVDPGVERRRDTIAGELGIRRQGRVAVARHLDLWDHHHEPVARVGDDLGVVGLRVEAAGAAADGGAPAVARQVGPRRDVDPPALVVREVQVQAVHLVHRREVYVPLHVGYGKEVPRHIEEDAAPLVPRPVGDAAGRHRDGKRPRAAQLDGPRQQLPQRLRAVEDAGRRGGCDADAVGADGKVVAVAGERRAGWHDLEADRAGGCWSGDVANGDGRIERRPKETGEVGRQSPQVRVAGRHLDDGVFRDRDDVARAHLDRRGPGYQGRSPCRGTWRRGRLRVKRGCRAGDESTGKQHAAGCLLLHRISPRRR